MNLTKIISIMKKITILLAVIAFIACNPCTIGQMRDQYVTGDSTCSAPLPNYIPYVQVSDNCPGEIQLTQTPPAGTVFSGVIEVTMTAEDAAGNQSQDRFNVYILDVTPPIMFLMDSITGFTGVFNESTTVAERRAQEVVMTEEGMLYNIVMYHEAGPGTRGRFAVYTDSLGRPGRKIAGTGLRPVSPLSGYEGWPLINPVKVYPGQRLWLAWVYEDNPGIRTEPGDGSLRRARADNGVWDEGMPEYFGGSSVSNYNYSIYADYTPLNKPGYTLSMVGEMGKIFVDYIRYMHQYYTDHFNWELVGGNDLGQIYINIPVEQ